MKSVKASLAAVVVLLLSTAGPLGFGAAVTSTVSTSFPITISVFVPCAAGGAGEVVDLSGTLHAVFSTTVNGNNVHSQYLFNPQGISGVGETTGAKYQGTGETRADMNVDVVAFPLIFTFVNNFKIIGQGPNNNFLVHENLHVTINADGTLTAFVDNFSFTCQ
jgi:hypothetical protein